MKGLDRILLAHGGGGRLTSQLVKELVEVTEQVFPHLEQQAGRIPGVKISVRDSNAERRGKESDKDGQQRHEQICPPAVTVIVRLPGAAEAGTLMGT